MQAHVNDLRPGDDITRVLADVAPLAAHTMDGIIEAHHGRYMVHAPGLVRVQRGNNPQTLPLEHYSVPVSPEPLSDRRTERLGGPSGPSQGDTVAQAPLASRRQRANGGGEVRS
jgi:hypothetical protein